MSTPQRQRRRLLLGAAAILGSSPLRAQRAGRVHRVGMAFVASLDSTGAYAQAFAAGLRDEGFEVGRNLIFDVRSCDGDPSRLAATIDELVALGPDLLAGIEQVAGAMRARTSTIPIVLTGSPDPVAAGLVKSLARPGTNVTGVAGHGTYLIAKMIELLTELLPRARTIALLLDPAVPAAPALHQAAEQAGKVRQVRLAVYSARDRAQLQEALAGIERDAPDGVVVPSSGLFFGHRDLILSSMARRRLAAATGLAELAEQGLLFSMGPNLVQLFRSAASPAARILRGANPAEIPVEQTAKVDVVINMKTARALGIAVPPAVLVRAERVIE